MEPRIGAWKETRRDLERGSFSTYSLRKKKPCFFIPSNISHFSISWSFSRVIALLDVHIVTSSPGPSALTCLLLVIYWDVSLLIYNTSQDSLYLIYIPLLSVISLTLGCWHHFILSWHSLFTSKFEITFFFKTSKKIFITALLRESLHIKKHHLATSSTLYLFLKSKVQSVYILPSLILLSPLINMLIRFFRLHTLFSPRNEMGRTGTVGLWRERPGKWG